MTVDKIPVEVSEGISEEEAAMYLNEVRTRHPGKVITSMKLTLDGDYVDVEYKFQPENFERIRRITGYLVGTVDRWNNGKRAEERDRVKHFLSDADVSISGAERI